ncbi:hypothetical protein J4407_01705 [Candidatus Pacearchaeota archaeon]|nr:hypothetical protein [Candidatus Pacearchaeota archaeon]
MSKKTKYRIYAVIFVVIVAGLIYWFYIPANSTPGEYDSFAQCLTDSGAKMYGAYWCPHCEEQKKLFGDSWKYVNYVECSLPNAAGQNAVCNNAGIQSYPTWEFSDGSRVTGVMQINEISQTTGCSILAAETIDSDN